MLFLLDSHCDAPLMLAKGADFGRRVEQGFAPGKFPITHVDFQRMKKGGVNGSFFAIYTSCSLMCIGSAKPPCLLNSLAAFTASSSVSKYWLRLRLLRSIA